MRHLSRRRAFAAVIGGAALVLATAPAAPATIPTGRFVGFVNVSGDWQIAPPDPTVEPGSTACQPTLSVENGPPSFTLESLGGANYYVMQEAAEADAYVAQWDCGSRAIIGAYRLVDEGVAVGARLSSKWVYAYGLDLVHGRSQLTVERPLLESNPAIAIVHVQTGAWWGKPDPATGRMVYYPAGCLEDVWTYTVAAHEDAVPAQKLARKVPCPQPPLPGMPELL